MAQPVFDYQEVGARHMIAHDRFGLHDEMGVGKTATTVRAVDIGGFSRGIVVCPAMLRENWVREFRKFSDKPYRICKAKKVDDLNAWIRGHFHILVCSYEFASKHAGLVYNSAEVIDFIALDEAHYLKNTGANRTRAILGNLETPGMINWALHVWHITGTPMANDPLDIYTFLRMCFAINMGEEAFIKRYFHKHTTTYGSRQEPKPEMIEELKALIQNNSIRRTKAMVQPDLPDIFLTEMHVDGDTEEILRLVAEHPGLEQAIVQAIEMGGLSFIDAEYIATLRRLIGAAKAIPYGHILREELAASADKRVVYGIHRDALRGLCYELNAHGISAVLIDGDTPERLRSEYVDRFQTDPNVRVFIGNIRAAGTGITLTAACEVDILESDWSPAGNAQAIMRVHRIGQFRKVRARFVTLSRTLDEVVNRIVAAKTASIARIEGSAMNAAPVDLVRQFV